MNRWLQSCGVLLIGGCSWVNAPERNLVPPDGGVDGGGIELFCDDGLDDDERHWRSTATTPIARRSRPVAS